MSNSEKKKVARNVADMTRKELEEFLNSFDDVLCDCDGVLYRWEEREMKRLLLLLCFPSF